MKDVIPKHVQIETINGVCTARCTMCTIETWTRKPMVMNKEIFSRILEKFKPYLKGIHYITLHFCGEPLLDREISEKVKIAKEMGHRNWICDKLHGA